MPEIWPHTQAGFMSSEPRTSEASRSISISVAPKCKFSYVDY